MTRRNFLLYSSALALTTLNAEQLYKSDVFLSANEYSTLLSLDYRLTQIRRHVGFGNFNLISYGDSLQIAKMNPKIGAFTNEEISLIDRFFYDDPNKYGFYGERTCYNLDNKISKKDVVKIPRTGHYIFKGKPTQDYERIIGDIGHTLYLTSGVRNTIKQLSLYCSKLRRVKGNITQASKDIAPPSHSFHTIGDFDVGKMGLGSRNFTLDFAKTSEFEQMTKLEYINIRYSPNNLDGVRYEPWHVKII
ncbi:MAG: M15 family metallopeptidase [Sulfurimonas sp.]|nr:M15 family metallopeptidase [Sulfurimonas sp.]